MVNKHHIFAGKIAAQVIAPHILHLVELDAAIIFVGCLQNAFTRCGSVCLFAENRHRAVRLKLQADMGQQRSHAQLRIGRHCADRRGQLGIAFGIQCQLFKKLLRDFIAHGIGYEHNDAFPHTADVCTVKCNLSLRLECCQVAGQALAPMHRQRVKEVVGVHIFH